MITTIVLLIAFSIAFISGGFVALKSVQLGLRWQIQTTQQKPPEMEMPNPIQPIKEAAEAKQAKQAEKEQANILAEWLNGPAEERG